MSAFTAPDLVAGAEAAGLQSVEWLSAEASGFLQPMLLATTPR
jgi:hypothetical protein